MTLIEQLKQIPDSRHCRGLKHPLWMILMLSLFGFLCGYQGYRPLADFCLSAASRRIAPTSRVARDSNAAFILHVSPHIFADSAPRLAEWIQSMVCRNLTGNRGGAVVNRWQKYSVYEQWRQHQRSGLYQFSLSVCPKFGSPASGTDAKSSHERNPCCPSVDS